jgi:hypothetical protein
MPPGIMLEKQGIGVKKSHMKETVGINSLRQDYCLVQTNVHREQVIDKA